MAFYFRTFRRVLSGAMLFMSAVSIILVSFMLPSFSRNAVPWLLVTIQMLSFMRTLWSVTRKSLLNSFQSVASEGIGLFSLFPFQLILALVVATTEYRDAASPMPYVILQTVIIAGSIIHILYTICLIFIAMITVSAFDSDVWIRDIDSSPSPFPIPVLLAHLFPRLSAWWHRVRYGQANIAEPSESTRAMCVRLPCTCPSSKVGHDGDAEVGRIAEHPRKMKSLVHTLIRVPDAAEQRASIAISFEVR